MSRWHGELRASENFNNAGDYVLLGNRCQTAIALDRYPSTGAKRWQDRKFVDLVRIGRVAQNRVFETAADQIGFGADVVACPLRGGGDMSDFFWFSDA